MGGLVVALPCASIFPVGQCAASAAFSSRLALTSGDVDRWGQLSPSIQFGTLVISIAAESRVLSFGHTVITDNESSKGTTFSVICPIETGVSAGESM
jgi:hypothetical protein